MGKQKAHDYSPYAHANPELLQICSEERFPNAHMPEMLFYYKINEVKYFLYLLKK
jgi:hypothetical protein